MTSVVTGFRPASIGLPPDASSTPLARHFVHDLLAGRLDPDLLDAAELCISELTTNAVLHAGTPIMVCVEPHGDGLRLRVRDRSPVLPRSTPHSATAATGRGLSLVAMLSLSWGVSPLPGIGKEVWCVLTETKAATTNPEDLPAAWNDQDCDLPAADATRVITLPVDPASTPDPSLPPRVEEIVLLGYPTALGSRLTEHYEALVRECKLLRAGAENPSEFRLRSAVPEELTRLATHLAGTYAGHVLGPEQLRLDAQARGEGQVDMHYPAASVQAREIAIWQAVFAEMDIYAWRNELLTPPTPREVAALLRWCLREFRNQAAGEAPHPWTGPLR